MQGYIVSHANYYTGDFVQESDCEEIQAEYNPWLDEVIYFGPGEDLVEGGIAEAVQTLAIKDILRYDDMTDMVSYSFITDPECFKEHGLDPSKKYIGIWNGGIIETKFYEFGKPDWPTL